MDQLLDAPFGSGTGTTGAARERADLQQAGVRHAGRQYSTSP